MGKKVRLKLVGEGPRAITPTVAALSGELSRSLAAPEPAEASAEVLRWVRPTSECLNCADLEKRLALVEKELAVFKAGGGLNGHFSHGHTSNGQTSDEYHIWGNMVQRCTNPKHMYYKNYGGKGITVCVEWLKFDRFIADMGLRPSKGHSIDRVDNSRGYEPGNVRWATRSEQANNTARNRLVTHNGVTKTVTQWVRTLGVPLGAIRYRLNNGKPLDDLFDGSYIPTKGRRRKDRADVE